MIEICDVTKRFGKFVCLDQVSLEIPDGMVYGLVGENGAGKSTLLRLIAGVYRADAGEIRIDGRRASCVAAKQEVFYMPDRQYYDRNATPLTVGHFAGTFMRGFRWKTIGACWSCSGWRRMHCWIPFPKG